MPNIEKNHATTLKARHSTNQWYSNGNFRFYMGILQRVGISFEYFHTEPQNTIPNENQRCHFLQTHLNAFILH